MSFGVQQSFSKVCPHAQTEDGLCTLCGTCVFLNEDAFESDCEGDNDCVEQGGAFWSDPQALMAIPVARRPHCPLRLVLDLDETLIHTVTSPFREGHDPSIGDSHPLLGFSFVLDDEHFSVFLRPGLLAFLRSAMALFELSIYSNGTRDYVEAVLEQLVGAENVSRVFSGGVIAREHANAPTRKELSRCLCERALTVIVDDRCDVWGDEDSGNLLQIDPFEPNPLLFDHHSEDPCTNDNSLERLGCLLAQVHAAFHSPFYQFWDVRQVLECCKACLIEAKPAVCASGD